MELLKRVLTAVVLIPLVLLLILRAPIEVLAFVAGVIALLAIRELLQLSEAYGSRPPHIPSYIFCGLFFFLIAFHPGVPDLMSTAAFSYFGLAFSVLAPFVFLTLAMRNNELASGFPAARVAVFAFVFVALPMACVVQLREQWQGAMMLLYLLLLVWAGDIFAYFVGKPFGRHRMAPRISPHKTWEGAVASLAASVIVGVLLFQGAVPLSSRLLELGLIERKDGVFSASQFSLAQVIGVSIVLNVAAQLGDLVESLVKRGAGVKDSGAILPGHGGMLDRIDALLFAAPVLWIIASWRVMME